MSTKEWYLHWLEKTDQIAKLAVEWDDIDTVYAMVSARLELHRLWNERFNWR